PQPPPPTPREGRPPRDRAPPAGRAPAPRDWRDPYPLARHPDRPRRPRRFLQDRLRPVREHSRELDTGRRSRGGGPFGAGERGRDLLLVGREDGGSRAGGGEGKPSPPV